MFDLVSKISNIVFINLLQIIVGYIISILLYKFYFHNRVVMGKGIFKDILIIVICSFCGIACH